MIDLKTRNAANGEEPELLDLDALLLSGGNGQVVARLDILVDRVVFGLFFRVCLTLLEVKEGYDVKDMKGDEDRKVHLLTSL